MPKQKGRPEFGGIKLVQPLSAPAIFAERLVREVMDWRAKGSPLGAIEANRRSP
jgi:hypothetical protein